MRRQEFAMSRAQALGFLKAAGIVHLAFTRPDGAPVLRSLNAAVSDEWVLFHGAPSGEKAQCLGRPVVVQAEEVLATIPSYFTDPEKACPATTFFRSVQVPGVLERIDDPHVKADALQRIMQRYQPEGGHAPIHFDNPMYQNAVRGVMVLGVRTADITGKAKLGQNRKPHEIQGLMSKLWQRGAAGDARTLATMFEYHPEDSRPERFRGPRSTWLWPYLPPDDAPAAAALLADQYWTLGASAEELVRAHLGATAWVGAKSANGELIATARANADGARHAFIADVAVKPEYRGSGVGRALVGFLLEHPAVRGVRKVRLGTRDAQGFYAGFGFVPEQPEPPDTSLILHRAS